MDLDMATWGETLTRSGEAEEKIEYHEDT